MSEPRFIALGMGRYVRADRVIAVVPVEGERRGPGHRTLVWLEGIADPVVASRGEQGIMGDLVGGSGVIAFAADDVEDRRPPPAEPPPPSLF